MPTPELPFAHFASVDWAKQKHHAVILNPAGQIVAAFDFGHSAAGWQPWREQVARFAPLAVAVETSQGTVIDQLLQTPDCTIYPLNGVLGTMERNAELGITFLISSSS